MNYEEEIIRLRAEIERLKRGLEGLNVMPGLNRLGANTEINGNLKVNGSIDGNIDASKITSGTLPHQRFSAYDDLFWEGKLGMYGSNLPTASDVRQLDGLVSHDFQNGAYPSGFNFENDQNFAVPDQYYIYFSTLLFVKPSTSAPAFYHKPAPAFSTKKAIGIQSICPGLGAMVGVRMDDGTDNNYVEAIMRITSQQTRTYLIRRRTGGGSISETALASGILAHRDVTLNCWLGGSNFSNWSFNFELYIGLTYLGGVGTSGITWTPSRQGLVFDAAGNSLNRFYVDAIYMV